MAIHDEISNDISNEISTMMKPRCLLSRLAACVFLFVWQVPLCDVQYFSQVHRSFTQ